MDFKLTINTKTYKPELPIVYSKNNLILETNSLIKSWTNSDSSSFFLIGEIIGYRDKDGFNTKNIDFHKLESNQEIKNFEGRFLVINISNKNEINLFNDYFGRFDVYWQHSESNQSLCISSRFNFKSDDIDLDQNALAQVLSLYGGRPLKKQSLNKNIKRLGVGESLKFDNKKLLIEKLEFVPKNTFLKNDNSKLELYFNIFIESLKSRSSDTQNIVFLSSGWDSTSILAGLVHLYGPDKIDCVIGRMKYSKRSGIINQFEIDRAKKIADYFKVRLHIVELDYTEKVEDIIEEAKPFLKEQMFSNFTAINHFLLAKGAKKIAVEGSSVFVGEISDGAHNFGFSQYFSIFHHNSFAFREYSDKMASYLFGPTFLERLIDNNYTDDPVWKIFQLYNESTKFDEIEEGKENISLQLLSSLFLSGGRIPLYSCLNSKKLFNDKAIKDFFNYNKKIYLDDFKGKIEPENLYSIYLHLYHSFHWQGGTVSTFEKMCDVFNLKCRLPFLDIKLIDFLSIMPESWGRGLDINNTKYPLKWVLNNKIDYPIELQNGPHSYIYDIDPDFSHVSELVNASSLKKLYLSELTKDSFINKFNSKYYNTEYIKSIILRYSSGEEMKGEDLNHIYNLGNLAILGTI
ncbi:MAG: hypothetical protein HN595_02625 [Flavobacteriaceae bacterium]|jgi:hypothetical protein|nr:hypothetical protein [Flavobacteriaceae bacterium]